MNIPIKKKHINLCFFVVLIINILLAILNFKFNIIIIDSTITIFINLIIILLGAISIPYTHKKSYRRLTIIIVFIITLITASQLNFLFNINNKHSYKTLYSKQGNNSILLKKYTKPGWLGDEFHFLEVIQNINPIIKNRVALLVDMDGIGYEINWISNDTAILKYKCRNKLTPLSNNNLLRSVPINF